MKITEKIVTSVTQPQQTNVLWHNPETGELKMFGNKGWEVVGGVPGGVPGEGTGEGTGEGGSSNTNSNGYPVVEIPLKEFTSDINPNSDAAYTDSYYSITDMKPGVYYKMPYNEATGVGTNSGNSWLDISINPFSQMPKGSKACTITLSNEGPIYDEALTDDINWDAVRRAFDNFTNGLCFLIPSKKEGYTWDLIPYNDTTHNINFFESIPQAGDFIQLSPEVKFEIKDIVISDIVVWDGWYAYWWLIDTSNVTQEMYYDKTYNVYNAIYTSDGTNKRQIYTTETITKDSKDFVFYYDLSFDDNNELMGWEDAVGVVYSQSDGVQDTNVTEYICETPSWYSIYTSFPYKYNNDTYPDSSSTTRIVTSIVDGVACFTSTRYDSQY